MSETTKRQRSKKLQPSAIGIGTQDIYSLEFDGASKGNPGKAGAGAILKRPDGTVLCQLTRGVGIATCNVAEYQALIMGLQAALDRGIDHIKAQGDSKLVCNQVMGRWKVKSRNLSASFTEAIKLKQRFQYFSIQHVYREFNSPADGLANTAIELSVDEPQIHCTPRPDHKGTPKAYKGSKVLRATKRSPSPLGASHSPIKLSSLSQEKKEVYRINYHGASNGKLAGAGVVLYSPDGTLHFKIDQRLGVATRNVAQYQALVIGLQAALECKASHILIQGDSLLVFKQMTGTIKVIDERLQALWKEANALLTNFSEFSIAHVDKCQNSVACGLAEVALKPQDCRSKDHDVKIVSTSNTEGRPNLGGCERPKIQSCAAGDMTFNKMASPVETSMRSLPEVGCLPPIPAWRSGLFIAPYNHQASRVSRVQTTGPLSKCIPLYAANTSMHKLVLLQCAPKKARVIPNILMHMQATRAMYKPSFSTAVFQICLKRNF